MADLIEAEYGAQVADAMRSSPEQLVCECCGASEQLRGVPLIMASHDSGGRAADGSQGPPQRAICSPCFAIWYDLGLTNPDEIGMECHKRRAAGLFPFTKETMTAPTVATPDPSA